MSRSLFLQVIAPGDWEGKEAALRLQQGKTLLLNSCVPFSKFLSLSESLLPPRHTVDALQMVTVEASAAAPTLWSQQDKIQEARSQAGGINL